MSDQFLPNVPPIRLSEEGSTLCMKKGSPVFVGGSITRYSSATPIGLPSSGTISDNGALSVSNPFLVVYFAVYLFFPAGAVFAGSVAGFYYTQMSDTQHGVIFNDVLNLGERPSVITNPTPIVAAGPGAYTQTVAQTSILSIDMEGNTIGPDGAVEIFNMFSVAATGINTHSQILFGGHAIQNWALNNSNAWRDIIWVHNRGVTNQQISFSQFDPGLGDTGAPVETAAVPTEVDFPILVTVTMDDPGNYVILEAFTLRLVSVVT
jgi:hypothetical protein